MTALYSLINAKKLWNRRCTRMHADEAVPHWDENCYKSAVVTEASS
ncbi:hypothetical protein [Scytonema sp. NUACC26]